jgi:hypothetical protein
MQAIRVALTANFLGLFGVAGLFANYGVPPSTSSDLKKRRISQTRQPAHRPY